jgi:hypothetical protein
MRLLGERQPDTARPRLRHQRLGDHVCRDLVSGRRHPQQVSLLDVGHRFDLLDDRHAQGERSGLVQHHGVSVRQLLDDCRALHDHAGPGCS